MSRTATSLIDSGLRKSQVPSFEIQGYSEQCKSILNLRDHLLIGISPFNSRFSPTYVESLINWGHSEFKSVDILLPDEDHSGLLLNDGVHTPEKIARKVRKELRRHRRTISEVINSLGQRAQHTRLMEFSDFFELQEYKVLRAEVDDAYVKSEPFRTACAAMSQQAILGRQSGCNATAKPPSEVAKHIAFATRYILAELPFYLDTPKMMGTSTSVFAYHRIWPIGESLWAKKFPLNVGKSQAHGILSTGA